MGKRVKRTARSPSRANPDPNSPWLVLLRDLESIYGSGRPAHEDAISDYSDGKPGLFFADEAFDAVAAWLREAYVVGQQQQNASFISRLEGLLADYTSGNVTITTLDEIRKKGWLVFGRPERYRSGKNPKGEVFVDGVDAMYLFECFLEDLMDNVRFEASVPPRPPPERRDYWTAAELGAFLDRDQRTVENWVSRYRSEQRRLPPWALEHPPGSKRGFRVSKRRFIEFYEAGFVEGLGKRKR